MSRRIFYRLVLAFALAFSGSAAQLHALAHAEAELARTEQTDSKAPSPLKHSTDQCLVVHALDGTAAETGPSFAASEATHQAVPHSAVRGGESPAAAFHSRAPPLFS